MLIKDLVTIDESGDFRSDVQLSDYEQSNLNKRLLQNYIFTTSTPHTSRAGRDLSAIDVIDMIINAFKNERHENRLVLTANYGHGKSHLALVLANYFNNSINSEEVNIIIKRLENALNNSAKLKSYKEFKQEKGEFLVIRLQGDRFDDLQEGFLRALEKALREHTVTRNIQPPFGYHYAEKWLNELKDNEYKKVQEFLKEHNTDIPSLCRNIRRKDAFELTREAFKHLHKCYPDFGREVSLKDIVIWIVDEVCIPYKLGGLLVLFDEFSLFLQKYAVSRSVGKLQELLNGFNDRQGKSVFLALTQIDIDQLITTYTQGTRQDDMKKELDRLPKDKRARLFSLMEGVLNAYLKQEEKIWEEWIQKQTIKSSMVLNRNLLDEYFSHRYNEILQWKEPTLEKIVVHGCFPLHPITTAILSTHTFEAGAGDNPRTVLSFIRDRWSKGLPNQPAENENGTPNYLFAIELIDFFEKQISHNWYTAYQSALDNSPISLSNDQKAILKALTLEHAVQELSKKKPRGREQINLLSALSGLSPDKTRSVLEELKKEKIIIFDQIYQRSSLRPAGTRNKEADKIIEKAIEKVSIDYSLLCEIANDIPELKLDLDFGHPEDWSPKQVVLTREYFNTDAIKSLLLPYRKSTNGIEEGKRSAIVWLLAENEEDKNYLRQNAQKVLDESLEKIPNPIPIILILPQRPTPGILQAIKKKKAITTLTNNDREQIGSLYYEELLRDARHAYNYELDNFVGLKYSYHAKTRYINELIMPTKYSISAHKELNLEQALLKCYRLAYDYRVEFYTQYSINKHTKLKEATIKVARALLKNKVREMIDNEGAKNIAYQLPKDYLASKWTLLTLNTYSIQPPQNRKTFEAWNRLEATFYPGCKEIAADKVLLELLNPPFGYDYYTLILLLSAWIGYHSHDLQISIAGKRISIDEFKSRFDNIKNLKEFFNDIIVNPLYISRINPEEIKEETDKIVHRIKQGSLPFTYEEAEEALTKLREAANNPNLPLEYVENIKDGCSSLSDELSKAHSYRKNIDSLLQHIKNERDIDNLLELQNRVKDTYANWFPKLISISNDYLVDKVQEKWEDKLKLVIESYCEDLAITKNVNDCDRNEITLSNLRNKLKEYPYLISKIENTITKLQNQKRNYEKQEEEKDIIKEIDSMDDSAGLAKLYEYRERLKKYHDLTPSTETKLKEKEKQIEKRISFLENIVKEVNNAINIASNEDILEKQKNVVLRYLILTEGTNVYNELNDLYLKIQKLEKFFDYLRELNRLPQDTPADLDVFNQKLADIETQFGGVLSEVQFTLIKEKRASIEHIRKLQKEQARQWLITIENDFQRNNKKLDEIYKKIQTPPLFLSEESKIHFEELKQKIYHAFEQDRLLKIEMLFKELDINNRHICLQRLQMLMESK